MTIVREQEIAQKLVGSLEMVEKLLSKNKNASFYLSHLNQISRLQRDVLAEILPELRLAEPVHSGTRSPYKLLVSISEWQSFVASISDWAYTISGLWDHKRKAVLSIFRPNREFTSLENGSIIYWSRLFAQVHLAIAIKCQISINLARIYPDGTTVDNLTAKMNISRRTIVEYLNDGFKFGIFSRCFPSDNLHSVGYRITPLGMNVMSTWFNLPQVNTNCHTLFETSKVSSPA